jgi:hypothetical protein
MAKTRYKRIANEVDAIQWTGNNISDIKVFLLGTPHIITPCHLKFADAPYYVDIYTSRGVVPSRVNDYFIKEQNGEVDVYSEKEFKKLYKEI